MKAPFKYNLKAKRHTTNVALLVGVLLAVAGISFVAWQSENAPYNLSASQTQLLPNSPIAATDIVQTNELFSYNQDKNQNAFPDTDESKAATKPGGPSAADVKAAKALSRSLTVAAQGQQTPEKPYSASLGKAGDSSLTFGNSSGDLKFSLTPLFERSKAKLVTTDSAKSSHIVYPDDMGAKHTYTYMRNGVKEDIILGESPGENTLSYSWRINAGNDLDVRMMANGAVGFYSADSKFYEDIQISDAKSQALIDKVRERGDKTSLAFILPAPYIKGPDGKLDYANASFSLKDKVLTLTAKNLHKKQYPLSIDPSVVVTTSNDFRTGFDDGMINYGTADQISRNNISLGTTAAWASAGTGFTTTRSSHTSVAYNGYLYVIGGYSGSYLNDVQYASLNSDGTIGGWTTDAGTSFSTPRSNHTSVAYNGFLYVIGGNGGSNLNDVQYAPINADGSIGTWVTDGGASFTTARQYHTSVAYNGFLYVIGGNGGSNLNDVQYAPINADGSISTWAATTSFTLARINHTSVAYNGFLYVIGGSLTSTVYYAPINTDGSIGTWVTDSGTSFSNARTEHTSVAYNGYLYVMGGDDGSLIRNDVQYAPINADGSIGTWAATNSFTNTRTDHTSVVYNGYLYVLGGFGAGYLNDIRYASINTGTPTGFGTTGTQGTANALAANRCGHSAVAYNGYLYVLGGSDTCNGTAVDTTYYAQINANGTIGSWTATTALLAARCGHGSVAYNGYIYVIGGASGCTTNASSATYYAPLNSDGTIGTWTATTGTTILRCNASVVAYSGYIYLIGGSGSCGTGATNGTRYAPLNADGTIGTWTATTVIPLNRACHSSVVYNGYVYVIGGAADCDATNATAGVDTTYYAPLNSDGTIGTWNTTTVLPAARCNHTSVAYNGYIYAIGSSTTCNSFSNITYYAPINANGTIGTWNTTTVLPAARTCHASVASNGYIYTIGGGGNCTTGGAATTYYVPVNSATHQAAYERVIDAGSTASSLDTLSFTGQTVCGGRLTYKTAGSDGVFGSATNIPFVLPGTSYAISGGSAKRYILLKFTLDDTTCGTNSNITDITLNFTGNNIPAAPTLNTPADSTTGVSLAPTFQMRTTDAESDYLQYRIEICTTSNCSSVLRTITQASSQTGWTGQDTQTNTAYVGNSVIGSSTMASHAYQTPALSPGTQYWWRAYAIDPGGSNTYSSPSSIQTFTTNAAPAAPTLVSPGAGAGGVGAQPSLVLSSTDTNGDYLQYKIEVCTTNDCSSILRTIDQTGSQTGWSGQNANTNTAYTSGTQASHLYQPTGLTPSTQYWWRAYAIDPGGSNTFSTASSIQTFSTNSLSLQLNGGVQLRGGTRLGN